MCDACESDGNWDLIQSVLAYAANHFDEEAWLRVGTEWTREDIAFAIEGAQTANEAISKMAAMFEG
jgi:hypothetical protein